jgi:hypothetical protein
MTIVFFEETSEFFGFNLLLISLIGLSIPFFILKILYDQKYPPNKTKKTIGYIIAILKILFGIFGNTIIN